MSLWFRRVGQHSSQPTIVHVSVTRVTGQIPSRKYLSQRSALSSISPCVDCWILCELHAQKRHPRVNVRLFLCFRSSLDFFCFFLFQRKEKKSEQLFKLSLSTQNPPAVSLRWEERRQQPQRNPKRHSGLFSFPLIHCVYYTAPSCLSDAMVERMVDAGCCKRIFPTLPTS